LEKNSILGSNSQYHTSTSASWYSLNKENGLGLLGRNVNNQPHDFEIKYGYLNSDDEVILNKKPFKGAPIIKIDVEDKEIWPLVMNQDEYGFGINFYGLALQSFCL